MFVVLAFCDWENLVHTLTGEQAVDMQDKDCIGYMPVYDTREAAEADYPNHEIREIQFVDPQREEDQG